MRRGLLGLLLILAALPALSLAPFELGAVRIAGVSLAWWYGGVVAPLLAVLLTLACLSK
ncbi:MAG: hypothetical protein HYV92_12475 [Candidatus Rokubacteria bacterium]|nr:hypothetical protein [Candidatus Rokubacteria bacterium]MBI2555198.1 hypothetical protein [Candidatus Rokubacteria bacterium]